MPADAIVIGAGPNGLVAANRLADAGWDVLVLEAAATPGGAVKTAEVAAPGFRNDLFSSFYPLGYVSPAIRALGLEEWGLRWRRAEVTVANPRPDGTCPALWTELDRTAASLEELGAGDGEAWRELYALWERVGSALVGALFTPFPPVRGVAQLLRAVGRDDLVRFLRFALLPVGRMGDERFRGSGGPLLLAGNALHADMTPTANGGGLYGWLLCMLGQQVGFPAPEGGAGRLTDALVARLESRGGRVECGARVTKVILEGNRAVGVEAAGERHGAGRAIIADVPAPNLFLDLVGEEHLPMSVRDDLRLFEWDPGTVKVDWALSAPIPWSAEPARRAGTLHLADGMDHLQRYSAQLEAGEVPDRPFVIMGQYAAFDPSRAPGGGDAPWAYTHVPNDGRRWSDEEADRAADRVEDEIERLAPGFRDLVVGRNVLSPTRMEEENPSLVGGAIGGGSAKLHQQLVFRPTPGTGRPETPFDRLYLGSSSAHPSGGVHGAGGANAATAALERDTPAGRAGRWAARRLRRSGSERPVPGLRPSRPAV